MLQQARIAACNHHAHGAEAAQVRRVSLPLLRPRTRTRTLTLTLTLTLTHTLTRCCSSRCSVRPACCRAPGRLVGPRLDPSEVNFGVSAAGGAKHRHRGL